MLPDVGGTAVSSRQRNVLAISYQVPSAYSAICGAQREAKKIFLQDGYIERFAMACEAVQEGNIPPRIGLANMEAELRAR